MNKIASNFALLTISFNSETFSFFSLFFIYFFTWASIREAFAPKNEYCWSHHTNMYWLGESPKKPRLIIADFLPSSATIKLQLQVTHHNFLTKNSCYSQVIAPILIDPNICLSLSFKSNKLFQLMIQRQVPIVYIP